MHTRSSLAENGYEGQARNLGRQDLKPKARIISLNLSPCVHEIACCPGIHGSSTDETMVTEEQG